MTRKSPLARIGRFTSATANWTCARTIVNLFSFAFGNLYRRPARTVLTVSAISLGIAAVVALTSIAWGFEASWQKANDARGTDLIVTRMSSENAMPSAFAAHDQEQALKTFPH